jgi:FlaA1/EpsC-like NDP-sugar epimerase
MQDLIRKRNFYLILFLDICLVAAAYLLAYLLRFEGRIPLQEWKTIRSTLPYILPFKLVIFYLFGLYKGMWRYTSVVDLFNVVKATLTSSTLIILAILFLHRFEGFPRSVFIIDGFLTFIFIGGARLCIRVLLSEQERGFRSLRQVFQLGSERKLTKPKKGLLIIGAGDAGEKILREIRDNPRLNYEVAGFLDDDSTKKGMRIHGVPVFGPISKIHDMAFRDEMDEILIALPSASAKQMKRVIEACEATGLKTRTTPGIGELIDGKISFKMIREVSFEDLLGRDPVNLDTASIGYYLTDKIVLVSGAGGSIGSELAARYLHSTPRI